MFTGMVAEVGTVERIEKRDSLTMLGIRSKVLCGEARVSDSIAVNGVCLTVTNKHVDILMFEAITPTLIASNLKRLKRGDGVNLEAAVKVGDRLGGHFVLGHVDGEVQLRRRIKQQEYVYWEIGLLAAVRKFIVANGSVALDGISLTVKEVCTQHFTVAIIPYTIEHTTFKNKQPGDWINIEYDYLLKMR